MNNDKIKATMRIGTKRPIELTVEFTPRILKSRVGRSIIFNDLAKSLDLLLDQVDNEFTIEDEETKATRAMFEHTHTGDCCGGDRG